MFVFKNVLDRPKGSVIIKWIVRVIRYAFLISLIVCASFVLVDQTARTLLYIGSLLGICVFMFIDGYTYAQYVTKKRSNYQNESFEEE